MFEDAGFAQRMRAVPGDEEGVNIEVLRRKLCEIEAEAERSGNDKPVRMPRS